FLSIDNFCFFIERICSNYRILESGIYHISDDEAISTKEIIKMIQDVTGTNSRNLCIPRGLVKFLAKCGDLFGLPLNSKRLMKLTNTLLVSNRKIKSAINVECLPDSGLAGLRKTIDSFYFTEKSRF